MRISFLTFLLLLFYFFSYSQEQHFSHFNTRNLKFTVQERELINTFLGISFPVEWNNLKEKPSLSFLKKNENLILHACQKADQIGLNKSLYSEWVALHLLLEKRLRKMNLLSLDLETEKNEARKLFNQVLCENLSDEQLLRYKGSLRKQIISETAKAMAKQKLIAEHLDASERAKIEKAVSLHTQYFFFDQLRGQKSGKTLQKVQKEAFLQRLNQLYTEKTGYSFEVYQYLSQFQMDYLPKKISERIIKTAQKREEVLAHTKQPIRFIEDKFDSVASVLKIKATVYHEAFKRYEMIIKKIEIDQDRDMKARKLIGKHCELIAKAHHYPNELKRRKADFIAKFNSLFSLEEWRQIYQEEIDKLVGWRCKREAHKIATVYKANEEQKEKIRTVIYQKEFDRTLYERLQRIYGRKLPSKGEVEATYHRQITALLKQVKESKEGKE